MSGRKSLTRAEARDLGAHMAQEALARGAQALCIAGGIAGAFWHGFPAILLGGVGAAFFGLARPGPSERLDRLTGRGD